MTFDDFNKDYDVTDLCAANDPKVRANPRYPWTLAPLGAKVMVQNGRYVALMPKGE